MSFALRPPAEGPDQTLPVPPCVVIRHPGQVYAKNNNCLLRLYASDQDPSDASESGSRVGLPHHLVHTACAIISGNRFDGIISKHKNWNEAHANAGNNANFLVADEYYFHVPPPNACNTPSTTASSAASASIEAPYTYPIVPTFRHWSFPRDHLQAQPQPAWTRPAIRHGIVGLKATERDIFCRLTNHFENRETAHIIPKAEEKWFEENEMGQYASKFGMDAPENTLVLREDIHCSWDKSDFSIVPKAASYNDNRGWAWYAHVHSASSELRHLHHNVELQPLSGLSREYLFSRYAWDLFPHMRGFLHGTVPRYVALRGEGGAWKSADECRKFCEKQGQNRSSPSRSPKRDADERLEGSIRKRGRLGSEDPQDPDELTDHDSHDSGISVRSRSRGEDDLNSEQSDDSQDEESDEEIDEEEKWLRRRRKEQAKIQRSFEDPDPYGQKRRREVAALQEEINRGRKRVRG